MLTCRKTRPMADDRETQRYVMNLCFGTEREAELEEENCPHMMREIR